MNELIIDENDLIHNINVIKSKEKDDYTIIAVVKGNAYGCGIEEYTRVLKENGITFFAVSSYQEALEFRKYNEKEKLLLLTPYKDEKVIKDLITKDIIFTIDSISQAKIIDKYAKENKKKVISHIKIDTGLSRYGFKYDNIQNIIDMIKQTKNIEYEGIFSHFSNSLAADSTYSNIQYERFINVIDKLKEKNIDFKLKHICNSSGYFKYDNMHLNASRIGSAFIGQAVGEKTDLRKIGIFHTKIVKVLDVKKNEYIGYANSYKAKKNLKVAILPTGYFDGIGLNLVDQRFTMFSKFRRVILDFINVFKNDEVYLDNFEVLGLIGMHDVVINITGTNYKENDDIYFHVRPINIDTSIKRVYEKENKVDVR